MTADSKLITIAIRDFALPVPRIGSIDHNQAMAARPLMAGRSTSACNGRFLQPVYYRAISAEWFEMSARELVLESILMDVAGEFRAGGA